ncbi:MAG TPA: ATP-dependent DNA helicase [Solirubrobacteraceae bacterium]|jgi:ATP-dependent exoDNAse (exonuclease V) beta subunit|nr:ATP-dependent DNA helicase [Solirubrobacteraceae bacterium]
MTMEQLSFEALEPAAAPDPAAETGLTREQEAAADAREGQLLLSAAAGSGKTAVLVERFVRAVRVDGVAPGRILAITFTERAAGELSARVRRTLLELGDREAARDTETAYVGTFHGFCARVLRTHPLAAGLDPDFRILDEGRSRTIRELAFSAAIAEFLDGEQVDAVDLVAAYGMDQLFAMLAQSYAELRSRGSRRPRLPIPVPAQDAEPLELEAAAALALLDRVLALFGDHYERLKRERTAVDFDDLELLAGELLARPGIRSVWSERFELLMVDEFQDTNPRQLEILERLQRENLFTVGDELQSIYGFRHADVSLFRSRRERLRASGASLALTRNFRSREELLDVVNHVFAPRFEGFVPLVADRAEERRAPVVELLLTDTAGWEDCGAAAEIGAGLPAAREWRQAEARLLAQRVAELVESGLARPREVVVLLRSAGDLGVFERALAHRGLRTLATVGTFWDHQQIGDLHCYLRVLANPRDEEALYAVLASPLVGCSRDGLALLAGAAGGHGGGVWGAALALGGEGGAALPGADDARVAAFCAFATRERASLAERGLSELIERVIAASGYEAHVRSLDWGERRIANINKLLRLARRFESDEGRDLRAFVDHVQRLRESAVREPDAPVGGGEPDAVRLMSIHAAKGLEFPVVCVVDLGRQPPAGTPPLLVDGERVGLRLSRLGQGEPEEALDFAALRAERREREQEEEDRVLYVGLTRARERLILSGSVAFAKWPESRGIAAPINWLGPALAPEIPELAAAVAERALHDLEVGGATLRCVLSSPCNYGEVLRPLPASATPAGEQQAGEPAATDAARASALAAGGQELGVPAAAHVSVAGEQELGEPAPSSGSGSEAVPQAAPPPTLSYTSLAEQERCGYRYYLERVLRIPEEAAARRGAGGRDLEARERGTLVHRLMESFDFAAPVAIDAAGVLEVARALGLSASAADAEEIAALIARAAAAPFAAEIASATGARREHPFAFAPGGNEPLVIGVLDLACKLPDGTALVVDYKSDRVVAGADLEAVLERDYAIQRLIYALALLREGALAVEVVHWFLADPERPLRARYTLAERALLEDELARRVHRAWAEPYAVSRRPHRALCLTCPGRGGLCSWSEEQTMRESPDPADPTPVDA